MPYYQAIGVGSSIQVDFVNQAERDVDKLRVLFKDCGFEVNESLVHRFVLLIIIQFHNDCLQKYDVLGKAIEGGFQDLIRFMIIECGCTNEQKVILSFKLWNCY